MKEVVVGCSNQAKVGIARSGFEAMFPGEEFTFRSVLAQSDVSDLPMTREETQRGATNRVENTSLLAPEADYWVGIESGVEDTPEGMIMSGCIEVKSRDGKIGRGSTSPFTLPDKIAQLVRNGTEIGSAVGVVSKQQHEVAIEFLTGNVLSRTKFYESGMIIALIPFKNPELY